MSLQDGQSELDSVTIRLPNTSTEIKTLEQYRVTSRFLTPCDQFEFTVGDEDISLANEVLIPGAPVEIAVNDRVVLTGAIDKRTVASSRNGGSVIHCVGRDLLGAVVSSNIDPKLQFSDALTVLDVAAAVLSLFGFDVIYNDGSLNVSIQTGAPKKSQPSSEKASVQIPKLELASDGSVTASFQTVTVTQKVGANPSLKTLQAQQLKPHVGEGAYEYLSRICRRFGLHVWAMADGSGVIIAPPDFSGPTLYTIKHTRADTDSNVIESRVEWDLDSQPSCIVALAGPQAAISTEARTALTVIMVNEIVGTDASGTPLPEVQNIIARYRGAKVLDIRSGLLPARKRFNDTLIARPMFCKDDESRTQAMLEAFCRRTMAEHQHHALHAVYTVEGHTQNGRTWAMNTMVHVEDEVSGLSEPLWIMERTFEKSRTAGTVTHLCCVRPNTVALS